MVQFGFIINIYYGDIEVNILEESKSNWITKCSLVNIMNVSSYI